MTSRERDLTHNLLADRDWHTSNELRDLCITHPHRGIKILEKEKYVIEREWAKTLFLTWTGADVMCYRIISSPFDDATKHARSFRKVEQAKIKQMSLI